MKKSNEFDFGSIYDSPFMTAPLRPDIPERPVPEFKLDQPEPMERKPSVGERMQKIPDDKTITISKKALHDAALAAAISGRGMEAASNGSPLFAMALGLSMMMAVDEMIVALFGDEEKTGGAE